MSKANYGTNSSGTGSFPNVMTVNRIIVQMNVNSSTIIVQVEYCVYTVTHNKPPAHHSPGCDVAVSPQLFLIYFYFYFLFSVDFAIYTAAGIKRTAHNR